MGESIGFESSQPGLFQTSAKELSPLLSCKTRDCSLLNRAADLGEYVIRIRPDEPDRAHDDHQNHSQHDCVFRNVLATLIVPKLL
jgi:hypothetical protein